MSSVYKYTLKDGAVRWYVKYRAPEGNEMVSKTRRGFNSQREAKAWAKRVDNQINDDLYIEKSDETLLEFMYNYLDLYCVGLSPKTVAGYKAITKKISLSLLGNKPLQKITPDDIQLYINELYKSDDKNKKTVSANTALHYLSFLQTVLQRAVINQKISKNPCVLVEKPKKQAFKHTVLTIDELYILLTVSKKTPIYIPVLLAGCMGLRRGEILGLRWQDIDFNKNTLQVNQTRIKANKKEYIKETKTEKSTRLLYMPSFVANELKKHKENIIIDISHNLVCSLTTGEPISIDTFEQRFERLLKKSKINKKLRFHDLRHTSASILTATGATPKEVSAYLGHSNIGITMDLYADVFDKSKQQTAKKLNKVFNTL